MKKITAIILVLLCLLSVLCGCGRMNENTDTKTTSIPTTQKNQNNGTVSDHDGVIGNENRETNATMPTVSIPDMTSDNNQNTDGNERNTTALIDNVL